MLNNKFLVLFVGLILFLSATMISYGFQISKQEVTRTTPDCSQPFSPILLRPSERGLASGLMNNLQNTFVYIPEEKEILSRTDFLECESFIQEQNKIIKSWGWNN